MHLRLTLAALALLQSNVPAFGSRYAGKQFFDSRMSDLSPLAVAHCDPDSAGSARSGRVQAIPFSLQERKQRDWPYDWVHVVVATAGTTRNVTDIEAAYGSCDVYAFDLDGDSEAEVAIESGYGRGTTAYARTLEVFRKGTDGYDRVLYLSLSGYALVGDKGPEGWERSYYFKTAEQGILATVVLQLRLKPPAGLVWAETEALDALQFPVREYCWQKPPGAYRLCRFDYSKLE